MAPPGIFQSKIIPVEHCCDENAQIWPTDYLPKGKLFAKPTSKCAPFMLTLQYSGRAVLRSWHDIRETGKARHGAAPANTDRLAIAKFRS